MKLFGQAPLGGQPISRLILLLQDQRLNLLGRVLIEPNPSDGFQEHLILNPSFFGVGREERGLGPMGDGFIHNSTVTFLLRFGDSEREEVPFGVQ
jgi:hypothetical protein